MALISFTTVTDGTTIDAADINTPLTTIYNDYNGNITNANIASGAAIATAKLASDAGIVAGMIGTGAVTNTQLAAGVVVQVVNTTSSAVNSGTTVIPYDDTIPQNTEGDEYMTLAITPKSTTNILVIQVNTYVANSVANNVTGALFQDSTANALAAVEYTYSAAGAMQNLHILHTMAAGTTSSTTFKFRAGGTSAGTTTFNGVAAARKFGGITKSSIVIWEYKA